VQKLDKQSYTKEIINIKIKIVWNIFSIQITVYDVKFWWLNNFDALNFMLTPLSSFQYENDIFCFINMIFFKTTGDFYATPQNICGGWNSLKFPYLGNLLIFFCSYRFKISQQLTQRTTKKLRVSRTLFVMVELYYFKTTRVKNIW
jgi:hypothetical protein